MLHGVFSRCSRIKTSKIMSFMTNFMTKYRLCYEGGTVVYKIYESDKQKDYMTWAPIN